MVAISFGWNIVSDPKFSRKRARITHFTHNYDPGISEDGISVSLQSLSFIHALEAVVGPTPWPLIFLAKCI